MHPLRLAVIAAAGILTLGCTTADTLVATDEDVAEATVSGTRSSEGDAPADETSPDLPTDTSSGAGEDGADGEGDDPTTTDPGSAATTASSTTSTTAAPTTTTTEAAAAPVVQPEILARLPHDARAFTQGLVLADGVLIESLGLRGESGRRRVVPSNGEVSASVPLAENLFGGGLARLNDTRILQLTLTEGVAIIADLVTLQELSRVPYEGEGWGVCLDQDGQLITSDGSDTLSFRDAETLAVTGEVEVTLDDAPLDRLNELECVDGKVWANVWLTPNIVRIDPATGDVELVVDASALVPDDAGPDDVLNGIAFDPADGSFLLTGKRWTVLYRVRVPTG